GRGSLAAPDAAGVARMARAQSSLSSSRQLSPPLRIGDIRSRLAAKLGFRVWYGIGLGTWLPMLLRYGHTISVWQVPRVVLFTLLSGINTVVGLQTRFIFGRRIRSVVLDPAPIFVLGHWRSGTTFLHELLASDPR